jgi:hypothetical protein
LLEIAHGSVKRRDGMEVGDVVPVVAEGRRIEREQPQAVHTQILNIIQPVQKAPEVADAVVVSVLEGLDVQLVEDRVFVPESDG